ncbi:hypothetical protein BFC17_00010 [Alteromonas lipolytica]|uniref:Uncharacterized protein n=1 Tax=Alteromonas lipolytica TaxID=1856405 RepID=A0A1E8FK53_9ALTE|nr:hypothetical protein BFC17_00010 [Alteromonas lipolytica]
MVQISMTRLQSISRINTIYYPKDQPHIFVANIFRFASCCELIELAVLLTRDLPAFEFRNGELQVNLILLAKYKDCRYQDGFEY